MHLALVYALIGFVLALAGAAFARSRSRARPTFYDAAVYHMTARSHRTFAGASVAFAGAFLVAWRVPILAVPLLAVYVLAAILYLASFARGYSGEDD